MISVSQGPRPQAQLGALSYNKMFEAGAEGIRAVAGAKEKQNESIKSAFQRMQDNYKASQITGAKVQSAITQNPTLFQGLEGGTDATSKSYKRYMDGNHTQQDVAVLNAYIDAANIQREEAKKETLDTQNKSVATGITSVVQDVFGNLDEDDYDNVTQEQLNRSAIQYISRNQNLSPEVQNSILAGVAEYGKQMVATQNDTADTLNQANNRKTIDEFKRLYQSGDMYGAMAAIQSNPSLKHIAYTKDQLEGMTPRNVEEVAAIFNIPKYVGDESKNANDNIGGTPNLNEVDNYPLLTESQVNDLSAEQQEKYYEQHGVNNFANDSQVAAQAVLTPDEQAAATMVKPDKPEKPKNLSQYKAMLLSQLRGSGNFAAVNSGEYVQLAEAEHAKAEADYKEAMIKYKAMLEIWKSSRDK